MWVLTSDIRLLFIMIGVGSGVLNLEESMKDFDLAGVEANLPFWPNDLYLLI